VPYLTEQAVLSTLGFIASLPGGAHGSVRYSNPPASGPDQHDDASVGEALAARVASLGGDFQEAIFETTCSTPASRRSVLPRSKISARRDPGSATLQAGRLRARQGREHRTRNDRLRILQATCGSKFRHGPLVAPQGGPVYASWAWAGSSNIVRRQQTPVIYCRATRSRRRRTSTSAFQ